MSTTTYGSIPPRSGAYVPKGKGKAKLLRRGMPKPTLKKFVQKK